VILIGTSAVIKRCVTPRIERSGQVGDPSAASSALSRRGRVRSANDSAKTCMLPFHVLWSQDPRAKRQLSDL